jgi:hypothetical protein
MKTVLTGSCYCGDIRYRIEGKISKAAACRCDTCSRTIDEHVDWLTVPSDSIALVSGVPARKTNGPVTRTFCGRCGTRLTYRDDDRGETDVTASSLDGVTARPHRQAERESKPGRMSCHIPPSQSSTFTP